MESRELDTLVGTLFRYYPSLHGFTVTGDLVIADVELNPWADCEPAELMVGFITKALLELMDECPETRELLRGRTFARVLH
jgi:hypothetical protein